ncbi:MAG: hypothetical protein ACK56K_02130 [Akkermansiaceae bacterium]
MKTEKPHAGTNRVSIWLKLACTGFLAVNPLFPFLRPTSQGVLRPE